MLWFLTVQEDMLTPCTQRVQWKPSPPLLHICRPYKHHRGVMAGPICSNSGKATDEAITPNLEGQENAVVFGWVRPTAGRC